MSFLNHRMIIMHKYFYVPRVKYSCFEATKKTTHFIIVLFFPYLYHSLSLSPMKREDTVATAQTHVYAHNT